MDTVDKINVPQGQSDSLVGMMEDVPVEFVGIMNVEMDRLDLLVMQMPSVRVGIVVPTVILVRTDP